MIFKDRDYPEPPDEMEQFITISDNVLYANIKPWDQPDPEARKD